MNTLAALQQRFAQQVQSGTPLAAEHGELRGHMEIYIQAYQGRMRQALASNFSVLQRALGDQAFAALAQAYCLARPSQHRSIRWWGDTLVDFMATHPALLPHPALLDIARMDWAMRAAFDAADAPCLHLHDLQPLAPQDWPALRLRAVPSLQLLQLQWQVEPLWHALQADANAQTEEPQHAPHAMLVWRQQLECRWRSVDASELQALQLVQQQARFATLCAALQEAGEPQPEQRAAHLLMGWIGEGLLSAADFW